MQLELSRFKYFDGKKTLYHRPMKIDCLGLLYLPKIFLCEDLKYFLKHGQSDCLNRD